MYKETKSIIYLIDPRINPLTTEKIRKEISTNDIYCIYENILFSKTNSQKKNILKAIEKLFRIYKIDKYYKILFFNEFDNFFYFKYHLENKLKK